MEITHEQLKVNLGAARLYLMTNAPFFGALLYGTEVNITSDEEAPSCAWTDGNEIFFNIPHLNTLITDTLEKDSSEKTSKAKAFECITFITIHELMHCMFTHLSRRGKRDPLLWNYATDISINNLIAAWFPKLVIPDGILMGNELGIYTSMRRGGTESSEIIYNKLLEDVKSISLGSNGKGKVEYDTKDGIKEKEFIADLQGETPSNSEELKDKWRNKIEHAKNTCGEELTPKTAGSGSLDLESMLDEIYEPKVDWRHIIAHLGGELSKGDFSFRRQSKSSIGTNYYLPSMHTYEPFVVVAVDTSGSISPKEYAHFMAEVRGILALHSCNVAVLQCDDDVTHYEELDPGTAAPRLRRGGGGTAFKPVFDFADSNISRNIDALLYFTDGYNFDTGFEETVFTNYPVIWVMTTDHSPPKIGRSMRYDPFS